MNHRKTNRVVPLRAVSAIMTALFLLLCCVAFLTLRAQAAPAQADICFSADTAAPDTFGTYTHNFLQFSVDGIEYEGYRTAGDAQNDGLFVLYTPEEITSAEILGGSFGNVTPIPGLRTITVTYQSDAEPELAYGNDCNALDGTVTLPAQQEYGTQTVTLEEGVSFFRLTDTQGEVHVSRLELSCEGSSADETEQYDAAAGIRSKTKAQLRRPML